MIRGAEAGRRAAIAASCLIAIALAAGLASCATGDIELPPTSGGFDYQLGGAYDRVPADAGSGSAPLEIDVVVRDANADPLPGAYSICYVNGFQTQPDEAELWNGEYSDALLRDDEGAPVIDPDWPDEYVLDPSSAEQRTAILEVLGPVIDGCAERGFDAVEFDNLDTWTRFDTVYEAGARELAGDLVSRAHDAGLAGGQKNAAELAESGAEDLGFDFAIAESCAAWNECADYVAAYGARVLEIEYPDPLAESGITFQQVCALAKPERVPLAILRDRELVAAGETGYRYERC